MSTNSDKQPRYQAFSAHFEKQTPSPCHKCHEVHEYGNCPAYNNFCTKCSKWNHFEHCCYSNNSKLEVNSSEIYDNSHSLETILKQSKHKLCCYCLEVKALSYGLCASCLNEISYGSASDQDVSDNEEETDPQPPLQVSSYTIETPSEKEITPDSLKTARSLVSCNSIAPKPSD